MQFGLARGCDRREARRPVHDQAPDPHGKAPPGVMWREAMKHQGAHADLREYYH
jgi:hypothetical protein